MNKIFSSRETHPPAWDEAWDKGWVLPAMSCPVEATIIAEKFDFKVCSAFGRIPFNSLVRVALDYEDVTVSKFLNGISNIRNDLTRGFREFDLLKGKRETVAEASPYSEEKSITNFGRHCKIDSL